MQASPPSNEGYMIAAYVVVVVIVVGYGLSLLRRAARALRDSQK